MGIARMKGDGGKMPGFLIAESCSTGWPVSEWKKPGCAMNLRASNKMEMDLARPYARFSSKS